MPAPRWVLIWRSQGKKKLAAAVVQLDGSVFIWHMIDWFSTACFLYGARLKNENRPYVHTLGRPYVVCGVWGQLAAKTQFFYPLCQKKPLGPLYHTR
jgi:hypothetical protein